MTKGGRKKWSYSVVLSGYPGTMDSDEDFETEEEAIDVARSLTSLIGRGIPGFEATIKVYPVTSGPRSRFAKPSRILNVRLD